MSARDRLREDMAEALRGFRLDCIAVKRNWRPEEELFRAGVAEILAIRLEAAYAPIFATLAGIDGKLARLAKACAYDRRHYYGVNQEKR